MPFVLDYVRVIRGTMNHTNELYWHRIQFTDSGAFTNKNRYPTLMKHLRRCDSVSSIGDDQRHNTHNAKSTFTIKFCAATATGSIFALVNQSGQCQIVHARGGQIANVLNAFDGHSAAHLDRNKHMQNQFKWSAGAVHKWNIKHGWKMTALKTAWMIVPIVSESMTNSHYALALVVLHARYNKIEPKTVNHCLTIWIVYHIKFGLSSQKKNEEIFSPSKESPYTDNYVSTDQNSCGNFIFLQKEIVIPPFCCGNTTAFDVQNNAITVCFESRKVLSCKVEISMLSASTKATDTLISRNLLPHPIIELQSYHIDEFNVHFYYGFLPLRVPCKKKQESEQRIDLIPKSWSSAISVLLPPLICHISSGSKYLFLKNLNYQSSFYDSRLGNSTSATQKPQFRLLWRYFPSNSPWMVEILNCKFASPIVDATPWALPSASYIGNVGSCLAMLGNTEQDLCYHLPSKLTNAVDDHCVTQRIFFQWPPLSPVASIQLKDIISKPHTKNIEPSSSKFQHTCTIEWDARWQCIGYVAGIAALVGVRSICKIPQTCALGAEKGRLQPDWQYFLKWRLRSTLQPCLHALLAGLIDRGHIAAALSIVQRSFQTGAPMLAFSLEKLLYQAVDTCARKSILQRDQNNIDSLKQNVNISFSENIHCQQPLDKHQHNENSSLKAIIRKREHQLKQNAFLRSVLALIRSIHCRTPELTTIRISHKDLDAQKKISDTQQYKVQYFTQQF